jgi:hypothetical protein
MSQDNKPQRDTKAAQDQTPTALKPAQFTYQGKTLGDILKIKDAGKRQAMFAGYEQAYESYLAQKAGMVPLETAKPAKTTTPKPSNSVNVVALKPWSDEKRPASNPLLRSALFGAIRPGKRRYMDWENIPSLDSFEIYGKGLRLDQNDLDTYLGLLHLHMRHPLGNQVYFRMSELLALLGFSSRGSGGPRGSRTIQEQRMDRLQCYSIKVETEKYVYQGSLVDSVVKAKGQDSYVLRFNPELKTLFTPNQYTLLDWHQRRRLQGKQLSLWLHGFYSSHHEPYRIAATKIRELSGSENTVLRDFRRELRDALAHLAQATGWRCSIDKEDKVIVIKKLCLIEDR